VARSRAERITELEATCADFKREKDKVTDVYRRLEEKYKSLTERAKHEKTKVAEAHAADVTKLHVDLDLELYRIPPDCLLSTSQSSQSGCFVV
jgi:hypothetical protein